MSETPQAIPPVAQLQQWSIAPILTQSLYAAAKLGIADLLAKGPRSAESLAADTACHAPSLYRLLRSLSGFGVFSESEAREFSLTPLGDLLREDSPQSLKDWMIFRGEEVIYSSFGEILHSVRTGESGFRKAFGEGIFDYFSKAPEAAAVFDRAMQSISTPKFLSIAEHGDFSGVKTVVDVGGGNGALLSVFLTKFPELRGVVADLPHVVERAKLEIAAAGLADRCECQGVDMFEAVPAGGNLYTLGHIIHDWDDDRSVRILRNCRQALAAGGRVWLLELIVPAANEPHLARFIDIEMLVMTDGGVERTQEEYSSLLEQAGLRLDRVIGTDTPWSIIQAVAA